MTAAPAITATGVSVVYRLPHHPVASIKDYAIRLAKRQVTYTSLWALKDVSLTVDSGEVLGLIGANGAGKSTLLRVLGGIMPPSAGRVVVRGDIAPMVELGAGFNGDLTALENVVLLGALLGRDPRAMRRRALDVIEWAELGAFRDVPIRTFSTGMIARLAFAVSTDTRPDVLLIDEVLGVGDAGFATRSLERVDALTR
jgi:ABC-2 type transport system ATP-binding protein/lipopolysaccharide transport system ATP-binding protein